jgi:glycosyltransferase involved in cell wall biosynthesis
MKIAQITTTLEGGAGIAAIRHSEALNFVGLDSSIVSQRGHNSKTNVGSKVTTLLQKSVVQSSANLITTFSKTTIEKSQLKDFEILHFHSIYNLIGTQELYRLSKVKPLFLSLHDQRLLTGGCHYSGKCENFKGSCSHCPQVRRAFQRFVEKEKVSVNNLLQNPNVHFISPSQWLADMTEEIIFNKGNVHVLRNPIPSMPMISQEKAKEKFGIEAGKYVIGFVSVHLDNPLKGLRDLVDALKRLPKEVQNRIHLLLIGKSGVDLGGLSISSSNFQSNLGKSGENPYSPMDLLAVPSRQDNSPNVIGEAFMSGVRVLGSQVGGIPELVRDFDCLAINTTDPSVFASHILYELEREYLRKELAVRANEVFGYKKIGSNLKKLYEEVL